MIKKLIKYFKRPKCKRGYNCPECYYHKFHFGDGMTVSVECKINAR